MAILPFGRKRNPVPAPDWDKEMEVMNGVGQWLSELPSDEAKFRVLTMWMWRLKSDDAPKKITAWIEATADSCVEQLGTRHKVDGQ